MAVATCSCICSYLVLSVTVTGSTVSLVVGEVSLVSPAASVIKGDDAQDNESGDDSRDGDDEEFLGSGFGFRGLREDERGDVGWERCECGRGRRWWRGRVGREKGGLVRGRSGKWDLGWWRWWRWWGRWGRRWRFGGRNGVLWEEWLMKNPTVSGGGGG